MYMRCHAGEPEGGQTHNVGPVDIIENVHDPKNGHEEQVNLPHELLLLGRIRHVTAQCLCQLRLGADDGRHLLPHDIVRVGFVAARHLRFALGQNVSGGYPSSQLVLQRRAWGPGLPVQGEQSTLRRCWNKASGRTTTRLVAG